MLPAPFTMPSWSTTRFGGGSSIAGAGAVGTGAGTGVGATGGRSVVVGATDGGSVTVAGVGAGSTGFGVTAAITGASCFKYCAATKANAPAGASISVQSPLTETSFTVAPFSSVPMTL